MDSVDLLFSFIKSYNLCLLIIVFRPFTFSCQSGQVFMYHFAIYCLFFACVFIIFFFYYLFSQLISCTRTFPVVSLRFIIFMFNLLQSIIRLYHFMKEPSNVLLFSRSILCTFAVIYVTSVYNNIIHCYYLCFKQAITC